jgi:hypothetical protein
MNRFLLPLWLIGAVLYVSNGATSPRPQCSSKGKNVILSVSAPPSKYPQVSASQIKPGFETIELLVPTDLIATGSIE